MIINKSSDIKIYFILGATRSGTTLLFNILNNHKNCVSSPEIKHLLLFYRKYKNITKVTPKLIKSIEYYGDIIEKASDHTNKGSKINITLGEKISYFELCKKIYFTAATQQKDLSKITTIVDKNPFYTLKADKLNSIISDTKFLCAVRDYRSFVLSNIQSSEPYSKNLSIQSNSIVWMFYNKLVLEIKNKYKNRVQIVSYEKLTQDKEQTLKEICQFFNIEYDVECFNYQENINSNLEGKFVYERNMYKKDSLLKPINIERLNAWKGFFSEYQLKIMDFWCSKTGHHFGYIKTTKITITESLIILFTALPYYLRAYIYFKIKSVRLNFYLNEGRRARYFSSLKNKTSVF